MSDLNKKRLELSTELMDLSNQIQAVTAPFIDSLTMKQYKVYQSFHLKVGYLGSKIDRVTKSQRLRHLAFKATILQERADKVNAELDTVLNAMYNSWELVGA